MNMIGLLVVLFLILFAVVGLVIQVVLWCLGLWRNNNFRHGPGNGVIISRSQEEKIWNSDLHQQIQLDQQWLLLQILSHSHEDYSSQDWFEPPTDWWE